jgi:hypothetical protein
VASTGFCSHEALDCGETVEGSCRSIEDCPSCEERPDCVWLQCNRLDSGLSNITTIQFNNRTGLSGFFVYSRLPRVEEVVEVWFMMGNLSVFVVDTVDFVALGASQSVFSACLPEDSIDTVVGQYETDEVVCDTDTGCSSPTVNQLSAQVSTISTSVGAAGGGGIGCFCGSCVIALL